MSDGRSAGLTLSRAYFEELIEPLTTAMYPGLPYAAGRLGAGSDVLGLDDEVSRDHDWGLRMTLIVPAPAVTAVRSTLEAEVPDSFQGHATRFAPSGEIALRLQVEVSSLADFLLPRLGFDPRRGIAVEDWLSLSGQAVLEITAGPVFRDLDGELGRARDALTWYPDDLWRYVLACDWKRLSQELPPMSRAADVGDNRGARAIAARLAQVTMHLAFLLERRWPPYAKWFGTAFRTLKSAPYLGQHLDELLSSPDDHNRQRSIAAALQQLLVVQNNLGLSSIEQATIPFWNRPHLHPDPGIISELLAPVGDPGLKDLRVGLGTIEQRTDNVDVLVDARRRRAIVRS